MERGQELETSYAHSSGPAQCMQLRGEYLFVAQGNKGMQAFDVAGIANKGISQRIITAPFSPLGHDAQVESKNATCVVLPTTQPINPLRNVDSDLMRKQNLEQPFHPLFSYAFITDSVEGLILVDVNTLADGEPRNNFLKRSLTWNPNGILNGARHASIGGNYLYIAADSGLVVVDIDNPLEPRLVATLPLDDLRATMLQFRYLFATTAAGLEVIDVTDPENPKTTPGNAIAINDARKVFVSRTYAYVAAGAEGLVIVDVENPLDLKEYKRFNQGLSLIHI